MKFIVTALIGLSVLTGSIAPAAAAYEPFSIKWLDQEGRGGHAQG